MKKSPFGYCLEVGDEGKWRKPDGAVIKGKVITKYVYEYHVQVQMENGEVYNFEERGKRRHNNLVEKNSEFVPDGYDEYQAKVWGWDK